MKEEIIACPFCGGDAYLDKASNDLNDIESKNYIIRCRDCRVNTAWYEDKAKCIHNWNTRIVSELERLARIGRAAEKALAIDGMNAYIYEETGFEYDITNVEELLKWAESED